MTLLKTQSTPWPNLGFGTTSYPEKHRLLTEDPLLVSKLLDKLQSL
jgi:hypothetical protein